jgi:hypothetical protein
MSIYQYVINYLSLLINNTEIFQGNIFLHIPIKRQILI